MFTAYSTSLLVFGKSTKSVNNAVDGRLSDVCTDILLAFLLCVVTGLDSGLDMGSIYINGACFFINMLAINITHLINGPKNTSTR